MKREENWAKKLLDVEAKNLGPATIFGTGIQATAQLSNSMTKVFASLA